MKFSTRKERQSNRLKRAWWKKLLIALMAPILTLGTWYACSLATYYYFPSLNHYFLDNGRPLFLILSGLLHSSLILAAFIPLWVWWKLLINEKLRWRWQPLFLSLLLASPAFYFTYKEAEISADSGPQFIAHRGLSSNNAAENTLEALRLTSAEQPDYLEFDIYETADLEFVVFHDENLSQLTTSTKRPHELTLAELTAMTVTDPDNGHSGKIPSLDQLLDEADRLNQKLLLDIKASPLDSSDMMTRFLAKYQSRLETGQHQVQSSDLAIMQTVLQQAPNFETFLITSTLSDADLPGLTGYSVPLMSLSDELYSQIKERGLRLYVWTTTESEVLTTPKQLEIDAIITSYLATSRQNVAQLKKLRDYHSLYYKQLSSLKIFPMISS